MLEPGSYVLEVDSKGFAALRLESIVVKITETTVIDISLKLATAKATVTVTAESPLVQTENSARGTVIDESQVC